MSIDARVEAVKQNEDGSGWLQLADRPGKDGNSGGIAGQPTLSFRWAPIGVAALAGLDIWGGSADIMLGETTIARRVGYTAIEFTGPEPLRHAIEKFYGWKPAPG